MFVDHEFLENISNVVGVIVIAFCIIISLCSQTLKIHILLIHFNSGKKFGKSCKEREKDIIFLYFVFFYIANRLKRAILQIPLYYL
jgi:hypothetical protein